MTQTLVEFAAQNQIDLTTVRVMVHQCREAFDFGTDAQRGAYRWFSVNVFDRVNGCDVEAAELRDDANGWTFHILCGAEAI